MHSNREVCRGVHTQVVDIEVAIMRTAGYCSLKMGFRISPQLNRKIRNFM